MDHFFCKYHLLMDFLFLLAGVGLTLLGFKLISSIHQYKLKRILEGFVIHKFISRDNSHYPCKLFIDFKNKTGHTLLLKIVGFKLNPFLRSDPKAIHDMRSGLVEVKFIEAVDKSHFNVTYLLKDTQNRLVWIPLDPKQPDVILNGMLEENKMGKIYTEIFWAGDYFTRVKHRPMI
jgi:hypothetical protein